MPPGSPASTNIVEESMFSSSPKRPSTRIITSALDTPDRRGFAEATSPQPSSPSSSGGSFDGRQLSTSFMLSEFTTLSNLGPKITASNVELCLKFLNEREGSFDTHTDDFDRFFTDLLLPFEGYPGVSQLCHEHYTKLKKEGIDRQLKFAKAFSILSTCHGNFLTVEEGEWHSIENAKKVLAGKINPNHFGTPSRRFISDAPEDKKLRKQYTADVLRFVWTLRMASCPGKVFRPDEDGGVNFTLLHQIDPETRETTGGTTKVLAGMFPEDVLDQLSTCITQTPSKELTDFYEVWLNFMTPLREAGLDVALAERALDILVDDVVDKGDQLKVLYVTMDFKVFADTSIHIRDNPFALSADRNTPFLEFSCVFKVKSDGSWDLTAQYQDNTLEKKFASILQAHFKALNRKPFDSPPAHGIVQRYLHTESEGLDSVRQDLCEKFGDDSADVPFFSFDKEKNEAYVTREFYAMLTRDFPGLLFRPPPRQASNESDDLALGESPLCS